jgi:hypothetical protein
MALWDSSGLKPVGVLNSRTFLYSKGGAAKTALIHPTIESRLLPLLSLLSINLKIDGFVWIEPL